MNILDFVFQTQSSRRFESLCFRGTSRLQSSKSSSHVACKKTSSTYRARLQTARTSPARDSMVLQIGSKRIACTGINKNLHESKFQKKPKVTLKSFINEQIKDVKDKLESSEKAYGETMAISQQICAELQLKNLSLDCGWTCASCQGALKNLLYLSKEKKADVATLRGRSVVLTRWTGVDPHGDVMLNVEDVPQFWLAVSFIYLLACFIPSFPPCLLPSFPPFLLSCLLPSFVACVLPSLLACFLPSLLTCLLPSFAPCLLVSLLACFLPSLLASFESF